MRTSQLSSPSLVSCSDLNKIKQLPPSPPFHDCLCCSRWRLATDSRGSLPTNCDTLSDSYSTSSFPAHPAPAGGRQRDTPFFHVGATNTAQYTAELYLSIRFQGLRVFPIIYVLQTCVVCFHAPSLSHQPIQVMLWQLFQSIHQAPGLIQILQLQCLKSPDGTKHAFVKIHLHYTEFVS